MIIISINDAPRKIKGVAIQFNLGFYKIMLQINPKKFKQIENKSIPSPLRPKFRNKNSTNIYFLSKRKVRGEKKDLMFRRIKIGVSILVIGLGGYFLSN